MDYDRARCPIDESRKDYDYSDPRANLYEVPDQIHKSQHTRGEYFSASRRLSRDQVHNRKAFR
jgi:hypothetical protein